MLPPWFPRQIWHRPSPSSIGGSVAISFAPGNVSALWASVNPGFTGDVDDDGDSVKVEFESGDHESELEAWWSIGPQLGSEEESVCCGELNHPCVDFPNNGRYSGRVTGDPIRERLLDAAAEVFAESGYEGARVAQIAERAGLTTGAIYNRFSGKSELLLEALDRHSEPLLDVLLQASLPTAEVLAALGAELIDDKDSPGQALLFESLLSARREPELADRLRPVLADERARMAEIVTRDQGEGRLDPDLDVTSIVTFCQAAGLGMGLLRLIEAEFPDPAKWQTLIKRLISAAEPPIDDKPGS